jgi:hypothetical protein
MFLHDRKALLSLVKDGTVVNPFKDTGQELVALVTVEICFSSSVRSWLKKPLMQGISSLPQRLNFHSPTNQ